MISIPFCNETRETNFLMEKIEKQKVNFIQHLLAVSQRFDEDERLSALHISLYYALFQNWNLSKFRNPISICREEVMQASKIGSANTYTKCLKELDSWHYLKYMPSFNPHKGSKIYMYTFNKTTNNGIHISTYKGTNKAAAKTKEKAVIPSTNYSNSLNNSNSLNEHKQIQHTHRKIKSNENSKSDSNSEREKKETQGDYAAAGNSPKKRLQTKSKKKEKLVAEISNPRPPRPLLQEIQNYFHQNNYPSVEAFKFYNHYESNGWLVGGKTPMQNWEASAANWILNANKFNDGKTNRANNKANASAGKLHTDNNKDYSEPL